uniref:Uncharacterized protein n=1 Tax=Plectus sambesii TaxID=2011161 RepID=A0A914VFH6_9BILA
MASIVFIMFAVVLLADRSNAAAMKSVVVCPDLTIGRVICSQESQNCPPGLTCTFLGNGYGCCAGGNGNGGGGGGGRGPPPNSCQNRCRNRRPCCQGQNGNQQGQNQLGQGENQGQNQGQNQVDNQGQNQANQGQNQNNQQGGAGCPNGGFPSSAQCGSFGETCGGGMTCLLLTTSSNGALGCCPLLAADEPLTPKIESEPAVPADLRITSQERFRWEQIIRRAHRVPGSNVSVVKVYCQQQE